MHEAAIKNHKLLLFKIIFLHKKSVESFWLWCSFINMKLVEQLDTFWHYHFWIIHFLKLCSIFSCSLDNFINIKCSDILGMPQKYDRSSQFCFSSYFVASKHLGRLRQIFLVFSECLNFKAKLFQVATFGSKLQFFWEGHKNYNLPHGLDIHLENIQLANHEEDCTNYDAFSEKLNFK